MAPCSQSFFKLCMWSKLEKNDEKISRVTIIGGASAESEATLSSCQLRFAITVSIIVRASQACSDS